MRKKIAVGMLAVSAVLMMTGCCLSHDWQEATCTEPKTCSKCGETEGEALGHDWQEATCTEPKTCSKCKETEGEALGHNLSEATYWEAAVCSTCGETVGDPLTPAFEELGVKGQFMEVGKTYDYNTLCNTKKDLEEALIRDWKEANGLEGDYANLTDFYMEGLFKDVDFIMLDGELVEVTEENVIRFISEEFGLTGNYENITEAYMAVLENGGLDLDARTTAQATVTDYRVFDSDENHEAKEGYEWKTVEMQIVFSDENTWNNGWNCKYGADDYYQKDDTDSGEGEDSEYVHSWDNDATHTVNWKGQEYTECRRIRNSSNTGWVEDENGNPSCTLNLQIEFLYPKGYDGGLVFLYDVAYTGAPDNFAYADENTLFFRMQ